MKILTIAEAAEIAGKSQKTVRRAIASGDLPATKIQNKTRIDKKDFDKNKKALRASITSDEAEILKKQVRKKEKEMEGAHKEKRKKTKKKKKNNDGWGFSF